MDIAARVAILKVLNAGAVEIRDIDAGDAPFLYSSGNWGPGHVSIKGLVGQKEVMKFLTARLAAKIGDQAPHVNFVAGNVSGGVIPGWLLSDYLEARWSRSVPFVYVREARKRGGQKELITGITNNPEISEGDNALVVEELVNFAQTTCNSAHALRIAGFKVTDAACILSYENPDAKKALAEDGIQLIYLFTLDELLLIAENLKFFSSRVIADFLRFSLDPFEWQKRRGLESVKEGGTK